MKNFLIFIFSIFLVATLQAQSADSLIVPLPVISADKLNVVYIGIDNPLSIAVAGVLPENIVAESSIGMLKGEKGSYTLNIKDDGSVQKDVEIKVFVKATDTMRYVCSKYLRTRSLPKPTVYLGSKCKGLIGHGELRLVNFISLRFDDFTFDIHFQIHEFQMIYKPKDGYPVITKACGAKLTAEMKDMVLGANSGDEIIITNVWFSAPSWPKRFIGEPLILEVK